jgi:hypothetical protein
MVTSHGLCGTTGSICECWIHHRQKPCPPHANETNDAAFAQAKINKQEAYVELHKMRVQSKELRETEQELQIA